MPRLTPVLTPLPKMRKPSRNWVIIVTVLAVLAVAGFGAFRGVQFIRARMQASPTIVVSTITNVPVTAVAATADNAQTNLTILSAKFSAGKKQADVTAKVIELLQAQAEGFTVNNKTLGADPAPGKKKRLTVKYTYNGTNYAITVPTGKQVDNAALVKNALK